MGAFALGIGCQRLGAADDPYASATAPVSDDGESDAGGSDDGESDEPGGPTGGTTGPDESGPCGVCDGPTVCTLTVWSCECWGDDGFCEAREIVEACRYAEVCESPADDAYATCVIDRVCGDAGGSFEDGALRCNDSSASCVGACDLDPSACDADGDGNATFACGDLQCLRDQYCYEDARGIPSYRCVDVPAECEGMNFYAERSCVHGDDCLSPYQRGAGGPHHLVCENAGDTE
jgi:hypothetical protein